MENQDRNNLVVKSNALVNALFDLTLQGQRFLAYAISCLDRDAEVKPGQPLDMEVNVKGFAGAFDIAPNYAYTLIETLADQLQRKILQFESSPGTRIKVGLITKQKYQDGQGRVWIRFDEDLVPHLIGLKEQFTQYKIKDIYQFQRASTWRVYELLKQYKSIGKREFDVEEFKLKVGVSGLYERIGNLKQRIIDPTILEINGVSDIKVQWEQVKRGRNVTKLLFFIQDNPASKSDREKIREKIARAMGPQAPVKNPEWAEKLRKGFGVAKKQAEQLARLWEGDETRGDKLLARIKGDWHAGKINQSLGGYAFQVLKEEAHKVPLPGWPPGEEPKQP